MLSNPQASLHCSSRNARPTAPLVTNAAKYAFAGRREAKSPLVFREEGAGWRLWVEDDGAGLPQIMKNGRRIRSAGCSLQHLLRA
jgi:two-component sensor histidine kinase